MSKPHYVMYKCTRCGVEFTAAPGPTGCISCGNLYLERLYEMWVYNHLRTVSITPGTRPAVDGLERGTNGLERDVSGMRSDENRDAGAATPAAQVRRWR
jgi:DNA-directed RNA polymerase subunit RPC12/RpoP